jgi:hypothetical protein
METPANDGQSKRRDGPALRAVRSFGPAGTKRYVDVRLTQRRLFLCLAALVAVAALTSACGGGRDASAASNGPPVANYTGSGLSFSHPVGWKAYEPVRPTVALHFNPLVYLSTQPVHAPCSTKGNTTTCGFPVDSLQPGGALVTWETNGLLAMDLGPGTQIQVGGHPATRQEKNGGECRRIGADETIDVAVETSPLPSALTYFTACLRGPGLAEAEKSVDALLASTKFTSQ